jgi:predicted metalloprotease
MTRSLVRTLAFVVTCLGILLTQATAAGAAQTWDRQLEDDDFADAVEALAEEIDGLWADTFARVGEEYESAEVVLVEDETEGDCGTVEAGDGSLYCPADGTIYLDIESLEEIGDEHGTVPAVVEIARQFGLHIQALDRPTDEAAESDPADARQLGADCWAGILVAIAEYESMMPLGTTAEIVAYLAGATERSDESDNPGALRVENFLAGYYNFAC